MKAKEFMQEVANAERELKLLEARRRHFADLAASMGGGVGAVVNKPTGASRVEAAAIGLTDLTAEMDAKMVEYVMLIRKAEALIARIQRFKFRQVLTLKYIACMSWRSISDEMGYKDKKSVYRVHGYALQELQRVM